jgi:putative adhesin
MKIALMLPGSTARCCTALLASSLLLPAAALARGKPRTKPGGDAKHLLSAEKSGSLPTHRGLRLRLVTDLGNVHIRVQDADRLDYRVRIETGPGNAEARRLLDQFAVSARSGPDGVFLHGQAPRKDMEGELWATFEVSVPRQYSLDVSTGGGNIQTGDITGHVNLSTDGGNLSLGNVDGATHLETAGGHIYLLDVSGDLTAATGGGHITAGKVGGSAILKTAGGHIRLASVGGTAHLETVGGNISLEQAGMELSATTGGGQIEVGEASGAIRAHTGGGGIRVARVKGPTQLETGSGSIYLTQVQNTVRASTGAGGITAWFGPDVKLTHESQLESGEGDIVVYLSKQMPVTIDARIDLGDEHHFIADPAFPMKVTYVGPQGGARAVRAEGALNGGGGILHLRTAAGNIKLILSDTCWQLQKQMFKRQMEQLQQQLRLHQRPPQPDQNEKSK